MKQKTMLVGPITDELIRAALQADLLSNSGRKLDRLEQKKANAPKCEEQIPSARNADGIELTTVSSHDTYATGTSSYLCSSPSPVMPDVGNFDKQSPPPLTYKGEYFSPSNPDVTEENNTTYLKPDFLEPLTVTKSEPVCPSPLALLAKTCQSIGQMMEASVNGLAPTQPAGTLQRSAINCSGPGTQLSPTASTKHSKIKTHSPTESKPTVNAKRPVTGRTKWMKPDGLSAASNPVNGLSPPTKLHGDPVSSSRQSAPPRVPMAGSIDGVPVSQRATLQHCAKFPSFSCPSNGLTIHSMANKPCTNDFTRTSNLAAETQTTSNALAQLARLSSSLSLPESPQAHTGAGLDNPTNKGRFHWTEPLRVQTGVKRARRFSGPKCYTNASSSMSGNSATIPRKITRETLYHSQPYSDSNNGASYSRLVNPSGSPNNCQPTVSPQSTANSRCSTNFPAFTSSWLAFTQFMQQLMEQKDNSAQMSSAQNQEVFFYGLARSFMDLFYARLMSTQSSTPNTSVGYHAPKDTTSTSQTSVLNSSNPGQVLSNPLGFMTKPGLIESERLNASDPLSSKCFLCGHQCSSQTELCLHVYSHLLMSEKEQTGRSEIAGVFRNGVNAEFTDPKPHFNTAYPYPASVSPTDRNLYTGNCDSNRPAPFNLLTAPSYLSEWISSKQQRDFGLPYASSNPPETPHHASSVPNDNSPAFSGSKPALVDSGLHAYWLKLLSTYTQTSPNAKYPDPILQRLVDSKFPTPNPTLSSSPNTSTSPPVGTNNDNNSYTLSNNNHGLWNPLMFPFFTPNNSPLTLYPKV
ncbi:hypothetical protein X801_10618 [Opisthorchis viverrini]|uniref:C2H2-type domain-containing protein n=1 Tax=Opisthorchis viverrini TaxID=6198 RepID=A0A1S8WGP4_OPIVI|nr:hypothetical protein X801_10618 [Opisthorchis viverrini]